MLLSLQKSFSLYYVFRIVICQSFFILEYLSNSDTFGVSLLFLSCNSDFSFILMYSILMLRLLRPLLYHIQVKKAAVDIVRGLTGSEDGMQALAKYSKVVLSKLSNLLGDPKVNLLPLNLKSILVFPFSSHNLSWFSVLRMLF